MTKRIPRCLAAAALCAVSASPVALAQQAMGDAAGWASNLTNEYRVSPNITYLTASNTDLKLDVYQPARSAGPLPTVLFYHGGGYRLSAKKEASVFGVMPYVQMGWNAINVEYRPSAVELAPAAVEDARCALRWVIQNAKQYNVDVNRIVVTGVSAGGHLALATGLLPSSANLDRACPGEEPLKVAAIVNWYGVYDYTTLVDDPKRTYATTWIGSQTNYKDIAARVSPVTYVKAGAPPTITIHGEADPIVPFEQATRLTDALKKVGVPTELVMIPGGGHGNFERDQQLRAYAAIRAFLARHGVATVTTTSALRP